MITYSIIQKSQLEGAHRLDAEYYQPEYLQYIEQLQHFKLEPLDSLTSKIDVGFVSSMASHFQNDGIPLLRTQNVNEFFVDAENDIVYIGEEFHNKLKKSQIFSGYLLLARSGSIGNVGIVPDKFPVANSADIILIKVSTDKLIPEFLTAYLNSKYGKFQVERGSSGGLQGHINLYSLEKLQVPITDKQFQEEVKDLVLSGLNFIEESKQLYDQAEDLLLEDLGLKNFKVEDDLAFIVNLSDVKSANRIDAECFQPKYEKLMAKIKNLSKGLASIFSIRRGDFINPDYYVKKAKRGYIRIKELPSKGELNTDVVTYVDDNFYGKSLEMLLEGDFVFAGIGATLGKTARIPKELEGSFYSNNTARFRLKKEWKDKVNTYYLQLVFQSLVCQWQFEQRQAQTAQAKISDEELKTVLIPILAKSTQQKIAELVRKAHEARKKSKELLEEAKGKVEKMIESGSA